VTSGTREPVSTVPTIVVVVATLPGAGGGDAGGGGLAGGDGGLAGGGGLTGGLPAPYVTVKLVPVESRDPVLAIVAPDDETMLIGTVSLDHAESLIGPVTLLMVAEAFVNVTEPKFASGRMPEPEDGASTIHSADDRCAPGALWVVVNEYVPEGLVASSVRSVIVRVNLLVVVL
jgi:hypothetical protein